MFLCYKCHAFNLHIAFSANYIRKFVIVMLELMLFSFRFDVFVFPGWQENVNSDKRCLVFVWNAKLERGRSCRNLLLLRQLGCCWGLDSARNCANNFSSSPPLTLTPPLQISSYFIRIFAITYYFPGTINIKCVDYGKYGKLCLCIV